MYRRFKNLILEFPRQFWILFGGTLVNSLGSGMVFPFLTLYLHQHLSLSMTSVGLMLTLWAGSSLVGQLIGGSLTDQFGRKRLMALSLGSGVVLLPIFGLADTPLTVGAISVLLGLTGAMYQPARDAMVADLVGSDKRTQAYSLVRVVSNLGIAIGPAIGGFLAAQSYMLTFLASAGASFIFFVVTIILIRETKPERMDHREAPEPEGSFLSILSNIPFVIFCIATTLVILASVQMMTVLPVYMKDQFGLGESFYGWVMTTNAGMVVLLQFPITRMAEKVRRLRLIAVGGFLYAVGVGSVALGNTFPHFVVAMAIATLGEMVTVPTATAVTANLAPPQMRGRYMSVLGLTWNLGYGLGPVLGGLASDQIAPRAVWPMMGLAALAGTLVYLVLQRAVPDATSQAAVSLAE